MSAFLLGTGFRADMGTCIRKLVLLKLIDACEDDGSRIFPAVATVARAAQCSERQVQREIRAFVDVRLLKLVREGGHGRRSTNEYALDLDVLSVIGRNGWDAYVAGIGQKDAVRPQTERESNQEAVSAANGEDEIKGDTESPLDDDAKGDRTTALRVTPETVKGDTRSHTTPPDSSLDPSPERERERATSTSDQEKPDPEDQPESAAFQKRVMRLCSGRGFAIGPWKDWDTASPDWIGRQFAALSPEERREAERWRDPYLSDLAQRGKEPPPIGVWLKGKTWTGLEPAVMERFEKRKAGQPGGDDAARPDGRAACLGPVGMARLFAFLLAGPAEPVEAGSVFTTEPQMRRFWPSVADWLAVQRQKGGAVFGERWHGLKAAMAPVPQGSETLSAWRAAFAERTWPWPAVFDRIEVVYCPAGGPEGLDGFVAALRGKHDGVGQEAAE